MKKQLLGAVLLGAVIFNGQAQTPVGSVTQLKQQMNSSNAKTTAANTIQLKVNKDQHYQAQINLKESGETNTFVGEIADEPNGSFFLNFKGNTVDGHVILADKKKAYHYYSDNTGQAFVEEEDINEVLCVNYNEHEHNEAEEHDHTHTNAKISSTGDVKKLESLPGAEAVILLDFDGEYVSNTYWNQGNPIDAATSGFSDAKIRDIYKLMSEDFAPFNLNITTNLAVFNAASKNKRMRCIFTPTKTAAPKAGGVAYLNSFQWNRNDPCWVFNQGTRSAAEAGSHEVGHTLGLIHDGRTTPKEDYFKGHGDWAPIMGVGYYKPIVQWSKGEYDNASTTQNDINIITNTKNGFGFRTDDHSNTTNNATALTLENNGTLKSNNDGIVEKSSDKDVFTFSTQGGVANIQVEPFSYHPNLNVKVSLLNNNGNVIQTSNPAGIEDPAIINKTLNAGTYYIQIEGVGDGSAATNGYSGYASLGQYFISGKVESIAQNQAPTVQFTSPSNGQVFQQGAPIKVYATANDQDGNITYVSLFLNNELVRKDTDFPYEWPSHPDLASLSAGDYTLKLVAGDNDGATTQKSIEITIDNAVSNINDLTVESTSCDKVTLNWSDVQGEQAYRIRRKLASETTFTNLLDVAAGTTTYVDETVEENVTYIYMVRPVQNGAAVANSNQPQITVEACSVGTEYVFIVNRETGKKIRPLNNTEGEAIVQAPADLVGDYVQWEVVPSTGNYFYLKNKMTGYYFRPENDLENSELDIRPNTWTGNWTQWEKVATTGDFFYLKNRATGMYIRPQTKDDIDASTGDAFQIIQKPTTFAGFWTQWHFVPTSQAIIQETVVQEEVKATEVKMYPNPAHDQVYLTTTVKNVQVFDQLGNLLMEKENVKEIKTSSLIQGVYIIMLDGVAHRLLIQ